MITETPCPRDRVKVIRLRPPDRRPARRRAPGGARAHTNRYSVGDNRIDITLDDVATSSLWWATKNEWLGLLDVAGLRLEALYGGFTMEAVDDDSGENVFVARR